MLTETHSTRSTPPGPPVNLIIGDNLPVMEELTADSVDVVYVDPPYNTGNRHFTYNDTRNGKAVWGAEWAGKHGEWLGFMKPRLEAARTLMKDTGVILVSIDNSEHAYLKVLMDHVFGEQNFIANIIWEGSAPSTSHHVRGGVDYILIYGKNRKKTPPFQETKPYAHQMLTLCEKAWTKHGDGETVQAVLREFIKTKPDMLAGLKLYRHVDSQGRVFADGSLVNGLYRPNLIYPVTDPATGVTYEAPPKGWIVSEAKMDEYLQDDRLVFWGTRPRRKLLLSEHYTQNPSPVFNSSRKIGTNELTRVIGKNMFTHPKDPNVLKKWIDIVSYGNKEAHVLDFFAGSGMTGKAVMSLNADDNGNRKVTLITLDENSIPENVTVPHLQNLITGEYEDGTRNTPYPGSLTVSFHS